MNDILYGGMMDVVIRHWVVPRGSMHCTPWSRPIPTAACKWIFFAHNSFSRAPRWKQNYRPRRELMLHTRAARCERVCVSSTCCCATECESGANNSSWSLRKKRLRAVSVLHTILYAHAKCQSGPGIFCLFSACYVFGGQWDVNSAA